MTSRFKHSIFVLGLLFILACSLTTLIILAIGFSDNIHKSDVAIILGSKVDPNGLPSSRLAARLDKGIELYQKGFFNHIIVSGGIEKNGFNEAVVMKNYLVAHHVPAAVIITDSYGNNTQATAVNSLAIMQQSGFKNALIISQYFHIARAKLALKKCGLSPIYNAHANYFEWRDLYSTLREVPAFYVYLLFRK